MGPTDGVDGHDLYKADREEDKEYGIADPEQVLHHSVLVAQQLQTQRDVGWEGEGRGEGRGGEGGAGRGGEGRGRLNNYN